MQRLEAVCVALAVPPAELRDWIARGWVQPGGTDPDWHFAELDLARVQLVRDLRLDADIAADSLAVVLSLLDQVYTMRRALQAVMAGLETQPEPVRRAVLQRLGRTT